MIRKKSSNKSSTNEIELQHCHHLPPCSSDWMSQPYFLFHFSGTGEEIDTENSKKEGESFPMFALLSFVTWIATHADSRPPWENRDVILDICFTVFLCVTKRHKRFSNPKWFVFSGRNWIQFRLTRNYCIKALSSTPSVLKDSSLKSQIPRFLYSMNPEEDETPPWKDRMLEIGWDLEICSPYCPIILIKFDPNFHHCNQNSTFSKSFQVQIAWWNKIPAI